MTECSSVIGVAWQPRSPQPAQRVASSGPGWDSQGSSQYRLDHSLRQAAPSGQSDILEQQQVCDQWKDQGKFSTKFSLVRSENTILTFGLKTKPNIKLSRVPALHLGRGSKIPPHKENDDMWKVGGVEVS